MAIILQQKQIYEREKKTQNSLQSTCSNIKNNHNGDSELENISNYHEVEVDIKSPSRKLENHKEDSLQNNPIKTVNLTQLVWAKHIYFKGSKPFMFCRTCENYEVRLEPHLEWPITPNKVAVEFFGLPTNKYRFLVVLRSSLKPYNYPSINQSRDKSNSESSSQEWSKELQVNMLKILSAKYDKLSANRIFSHAQNIANEFLRLALNKGHSDNITTHNNYNDNISDNNEKYDINTLTDLTQNSNDESPEGEEGEREKELHQSRSKSLSHWEHTPEAVATTTQSQSQSPASVSSNSSLYSTCKGLNITKYSSLKKLSKEIIRPGDWMEYHDT
eukprot:gene12360-26005_t